MITNKKVQSVIGKHQAQSQWKPARVIADLVKAGLSQQGAEIVMKENAPARKQHKPHNSHAKPVNVEQLSTHYIVVGDYELLDLRHQDALIAAVRGAAGKSGRTDGAMAMKLFGLVKAYPVITTAEVNKYLNRGSFIDSIPLFIDGEEVAGEAMPSADNDYVKEVFNAVKQLKKITDGLIASGSLQAKKYLERVPTEEDVRRAVGIVAPKITNPYFHTIDYDRDYRMMPHPAHREDSKRIIEEWKEQLSTKASSKPRGRTLARDTNADAVAGEIDA